MADYQGITVAKNSIVNVIAKNSTGTTINTFNVSMYDTSDGIVYNYSTTAGLIIVPTIKGNTYTINTSASDYVSTIENKTITYYNDSYNATLYKIQMSITFIGNRAWATVFDPNMINIYNYTNVTGININLSNITRGYITVQYGKNSTTLNQKYVFYNDRTNLS